MTTCARFRRSWTAVAEPGQTEDGWPDISSSRGGHITIPVPLAGLAQVLQAAFPDLAVAGLRLVGTGFGSTVLETGGGIILRVPRTAAAARGHGVEAAVLPVLAPMLPFNAPVPAFFCPQAPGLPFGAIGYPRLAGQPCQPPTATAATARDLGIFLAVLHHADARRLPALPGQDDVWLGWRNLRAASGPVLGGRLTSRENQRLSQWWDQFLGDRRMQYYRPAVRHGDLWCGNLLIQPSGAIAAVLDWEAVAVADPAQDLALARYLGPSFAAAVLSAYSDHGGACDEHLLHRIERHWELREFTGIPLAAAAGDDDEVSECIAKLRSGPVLSQ